MRRSLLIALGCAAALLGAAPTSRARPERTPMLGDAVVPISYDLTLEPDPTAARMESGGKAPGSETIVVQVGKPVSRIVLNAALVTVASAQIDGRAAASTMYPRAEQIAFGIGAMIAPGRHRLHIVFTGTILENAAGLWPDNLTNPRAPNLVSAFEPSRARTLFPCFDEPRFRASFRLHIVAPRAWTVVSNMPLSHDVAAASGKTHTVSFEPTPPMPSYLLTLDMGVFSAVHGTAAGTPIGVYVRPGQEPLAHTILATIQQVLPYDEHLFDVPFPMPKLDYVVGSGVLNDVHEGWGAITTYTESDVGGKQFQGQRARQEAFDYVAFPLAQQWFGGLVGIRSFGDAFATNGLASWAVARVEAALHPEFPPPDIDWDWNSISLWGSLTAIHRTSTDDRDSAAFTDLAAGSTNAGVAVLRQYNAYVGNAAMDAAAHRYLMTNAGKAVGDDAFWSSFGTQEAVAYGHAWLNQPGAPVVRITSRCDGAGMHLTLRQQPVRSAYLRSRRTSSWPIPISLTVSGHPRWVMLESTPVQIESGTCSHPPIANLGLRPPYVVHYDTAALAAIERDPSLNIVDRLRLVRDTSTLYHGGKATLPELLIAFDGYGRLDGIDLPAGLPSDLSRAIAALRGTPYEGTVAADVQRVVVPALRSMGFSSRENGPPSAQAAYMLIADVPEPHFARDALQAWRETRSSPSGWLAMSYWWFAACAGSAATPNDVDWALRHIRRRGDDYLDSGDPLNFLGGTRSTRGIARILDSLERRRIDYPYIVWAIGANNPQTISAYLDTHVRDILGAVPPSQQAWALTSGVANGPWTARTPDEWLAFFRRNLTARDAQTIHAAMKVIRENWALRRRLEAQMAHAQ